MKKMAFFWALIFIIAMMAESHAQGITLQDIIPKNRWTVTGIAKLSPEEQQQLAKEIISSMSSIYPANDKGMAVIAPSVSTSIKAREILAGSHKAESPLRRANKILVVVRSSLYNPLRFSYETVCELKEDAGRQLNISGPQYHIYIYSMDDDLRVTQDSHQSASAD